MVSLFLSCRALSSLPYAGLSRRTARHYLFPVVMKEAPAVNLHAVEGGVLVHVDERLLKVLSVTVDPLALVAALGDGVKLLRTEVTRKSHAVD